MRLPYTEDPPQKSDEESAAIVNRVRERRIAAGYTGLVELDRTLLHSPPVADGWNSFLGAVRTRTHLPPSIREVIICRVAAINNAQYEWKAHEPYLIKGLMDDKVTTSSTHDTNSTAVSKIIAAIRDNHTSDFTSISGIDAAWAEKANAVLQYTDAMTKSVTVPSAIWQKLKESWHEVDNSERALVEITATCAAYNCVSRFLVALEVGE